MFFQVDDELRIVLTTDNVEYAAGMAEFAFPDDFDFSKQYDYKIVDGELVHDPIPVPEPGPSLAEQAMDAATEAKATADEALQAAASGGANPQLQAIARMQVMTMGLEAQPSSAVAEFRDYWPEWQPDTAYGFQQPLQYDGRYFRTSQKLTSSTTYPPGSSESLYYEVEIAPDGVIVYRACHGSYDAVQKGETRHYPDADGPIYRSEVDNNAYPPDVVPANWELVE